MKFEERKTGAHARAPKAVRALRAAVLSAVAAAVLTACGGGSGSDAQLSGNNEAQREQAEGARGDSGVRGNAAGHADAFRLLTRRPSAPPTPRSPTCATWASRPG